MKTLNLENKRFGKLLVIKQMDSYVSPKGCRKSKWLCICDCGKETIVMGADLTSGKTTSCGCTKNYLSGLRAKKHFKKENHYEFENNIGICYTRQGKSFIFDKEDYEKIKDYCWTIGNRGYPVTTIHYDKNKRQTLLLHRLLLGKNKKLDIDHINRIKTDNRKENLRFITRSENVSNRVLKTKTGKTGVYLSKGKYIATITYSKKSYYLGSFHNLDDAIKARKEAEMKYYGFYFPS